jgi:hypothetical protein
MSPHLYISLLLCGVQKVFCIWLILHKFISEACIAGANLLVLEVAQKGAGIAR